MTLYTETQSTNKLLFKPEYENIIQSKKQGIPNQLYLTPVKATDMGIQFTQHIMQEEDDAPKYESMFKDIPERPERKDVIIPELKGIYINHPEVTSTIRRLLRIFWAIVASKALQSFFPLDRASITITHDPPEERAQVVLRLFTEANASQSVAFWDSLENDITSWISRLNERERLIFIRDISLRIHWR